MLLNTHPRLLKKLRKQAGQDQKENNTAHNTDGRVNKLVTVFESSCTQDKFVIAHVPGYAHLTAIKILYRDSFLAPRQFVPRHCASARNQLCNRG
jgi:hypothetical protein